MRSQPDPVETPPTPGSPEEERVMANGLRHRVLRWNRGGRRTVLLCHGYLDQAWSFAGVAAPLVEAGLEVIAFDWRGHGATDWVGRGGYYHFLNYVHDLHALLPQLSKAPVHLVGHSMGGTVCALFAATHPEALRTLTLIEGMGPPEYAADPVDRVELWLKSVDRIRGAESKALKDVADAAARLRAANSALPEQLALFLAQKGTCLGDEGQLRWCFDPLHRSRSPQGFKLKNFGPFLERISTPTLIIQGSAGFKTPDHEERTKLIEGAKEVMIEDVGHMIHWMKPHQLSALLLSHMGCKP